MNTKRWLTCLPVLAILATGSIASADVPASIEISAPIFPSVEVLYRHSGQNFPATVDQEIQVVLEASMSFPVLLDLCAPRYPGITLASPDEPLTPEQLARNYNEVARCSYELYFSKPYWIPQLVDDVDVCGLILGSDWDLPSREDVEALSEDDLRQLRSVLTEAAGDQWWGGFYFALQIYVRGDDGSLMQADLGPGADSRVRPFDFGIGGIDPRQHLEADARGPTVLRCVRRHAQ